MFYNIFHRTLTGMLESRFSPGVRSLQSGASRPSAAAATPDNNSNREGQQQAGGEAQQPQQQEEQNVQRVSLDSERIRNPVRTVVGALLLPAISSLVGTLFLEGYIRHTFRRNVLGGILFVVTQDILSMFYRYFRHKRQSQRTIRDYSNETRNSQEE